MASSSLPTAIESVKIVGSSVFGIHPFINTERTYNMYESDGALIPLAAYRFVYSVTANAGEGRGIFNSARGGFVLVVVGNIVYRINAFDQFVIPIGTISTSSGEVVMDENLDSQIAIAANPHLYVYNYSTGDFGIPASITANTSLVTNYISQQNTYFLVGNANQTSEGSKWFIYSSAGNAQLTLTATLALQTKADRALAVIRIPGQGNNVLVMGNTVSEIWQNVPTAQIYQKNSSINIDYGTPSVSTIAANDVAITWLSINEKSSPCIRTLSGGQALRISTDGIDNLLKSVVFPEDSTAFYYTQDGHLFYQLTFFNQVDNFTILYDFNKKAFYDRTDYDSTYHPARQIVYFDNGIYFINIKDGRIYQTATQITHCTLEDGSKYEVPRIRICNTLRQDKPFRVNLLSFTLENGVEQDVTGHLSFNNDIPFADVTPYQPRVDFNFSKNSGQTYGNVKSYNMHTVGNYKNQPRFTNMGSCNQFTAKFLFWGFGRFIISDVKVEISR